MKDPSFHPAALLLDLDGVLVRSHEAHLAALQEAFASHGLSFPEEARALVFGGASRSQVLAEAGVPEELRADIAHAKERAFLGALDRNELLPVKGAERFLRVLNNLV